MRPLALLLLLAGVALAQDPPPVTTPHPYGDDGIQVDPEPEKEAPGVNAASLLIHAVNLQQQLLRAHDNLLFVFQDEWVRIAARGGDTDEERAAQLGAEVKGHMRLLKGLQGQLTEAYHLLRATDPDEWPPTMRNRFQGLQVTLDEKRDRVTEGLRGLEAHIDMNATGEVILRPPSMGPTLNTSTTAGGPGGGGGGPGLPPPSPPDDPDAPPVPEDAERVGFEILSGRLATSADVVTVFERLPDSPRGSLEAMLGESVDR